MVVLRYKSFNAFETRLTEPAMKKVFGDRPVPKCIDTLRNALKHSYIHDDVGTTAMMYIFMIAYNLFQLFLHRRLGEKTRKTYTNIALAKEMELDYPQIASRDEGFFPTPES